ncbi:hypothetical protein OEZ71_05680 [Defluviimonas sp. WL0050]|uniref:Uncharacterized protein n=1 Tax=Albidovulum litorale TaxID=2984134 RepID=A0ABT2ZL30_9RHOB|nr:hypothetical protein [Defluviimonas sp. WL0050]MCV2871780.1 hypothetical protein [Defluviimonas sp. WL0050]
MSKVFLGAFVALAVIAVGAVDYVNQARRAESTPGAFGATDYLKTISDRFGDHQAALAAETERNRLRGMDPRDHLPEAPEGWTRTDWDAGAEALFGGRYDLQKDDFAPDELKNDPVLKALSSAGKAMVDAQDASEVYVYQKPGAVIAMRLTRLAPEPGGFSGMAMQMAANNIEAMSGKNGYAIVKGVTYREELGLFGAQAMERDHKVITGQIGKELRVSVRSLAEDGDVLTLLNLIDYDRLNAMLTEPLPGIGSDAPVIAEEDQKAEAQRRVAEASRQQRIRARAADIDLQMAALEINRRHGRLDDEQYETAKARLEAASQALLDEAAAPQVVVEEKKAEVEPEAPQEIQQAAAKAPAAEAPATGGGGIMSMLSGLFGGGASKAEAAPQAEVKVNRGTFGNCSELGSAKRCTIGD